MNILSIDTSSHILGVSIKTNKKNIVYNKFTEYQHEEKLFDTILDCLKKINIDIGDIDKIVVSNGPGSYTGLRIGVSCALGLSIKKNIPIVYVDTLEQLSYNLINQYDYILPIIDAKANRVYSALFDKNCKRVTNDEIIDVDKLIEILNNKICNKNLQIKIGILGDGVDAYYDKLSKEINKNIIVKMVDKKLRYNNSYNLCIIGENKECGNIVNINYMQKSQAERNLDNK